MDTPQLTTIEVNGVKLEVDLRTARRVDQFRVGTRVKVLYKEYETAKVAHGVVIGFEPFKKLPTIIVAYMKNEYGQPKLDWLYFNANSKDFEMVAAKDEDVAALDKADIVAHLDREIAKKQLEIDELKVRKGYFLDKFACYWTEVEKAVADATAQ